MKYIFLTCFITTYTFCSHFDLDELSSLKPITEENIIYSSNKKSTSEKADIFKREFIAKSNNLIQLFTQLDLMNTHVDTHIPEIPTSEITTPYTFETKITIPNLNNFNDMVTLVKNIVTTLEQFITNYNQHPLLPDFEIEDTVSLDSILTAPKSTTLATYYSRLINETINSINYLVNRVLLNKLPGIHLALQERIRIYQKLFNPKELNNATAPEILNGLQTLTQQLTTTIKELHNYIQTIKTAPWETLLGKIEALQELKTKIITTTELINTDLNGITSEQKFGIFSKKTVIKQPGLIDLNTALIQKLNEINVTISQSKQPLQDNRQQFLMFDETEPIASIDYDAFVPSYNNKKYFNTTILPILTTINKLLTIMANNPTIFWPLQQNITPLTSDNTFHTTVNSNSVTEPLYFENNLIITPINTDFIEKTQQLLMFYDSLPKKELADSINFFIILQRSRNNDNNQAPTIASSTFNINKTNNYIIPFSTFIDELKDCIKRRIGNVIKKEWYAKLINNTKTLTDGIQELTPLIQETKTLLTTMTPVDDRLITLNQRIKKIQLKLNELLNHLHELSSNQPFLNALLKKEFISNNIYTELTNTDKIKASANITTLFALNNTLYQKVTHYRTMFSTTLSAQHIKDNNSTNIFFGFDTKQMPTNFEQLTHASETDKNNFIHYWNECPSKEDRRDLFFTMLNNNNTWENCITLLDTLNNSLQKQHHNISVSTEEPVKSSPSSSDKNIHSEAEEEIFK
jgi:hypothetical protein